MLLAGTSYFLPSLSLCLPPTPGTRIQDNGPLRFDRARTHDANISAEVNASSELRSCDLNREKERERERATDNANVSPQLCRKLDYVRFARSRETSSRTAFHCECEGVSSGRNAGIFGFNDYAFRRDS